MAGANKHLDELLKLPRDERSLAAEALLRSLEEDGTDLDAEVAWELELRRRLGNSAPGIPAQTVLAEGRHRLKRP